VPTLGPTATQNRFNLYFQKFISVFDQQGQPLALFLDYPQWADSNSLDVIFTLMTGAGNESLLILAAYRDNEVPSHHPLPKLLVALREQGATVRETTLQPLAEEHVASLIADTLRVPGASAAPLARLVVKKTRGNPFFVRVFLRSLQEEGVLGYAPDFGWHWDLDRIAAQCATDNVVELMARKTRPLGARGPTGVEARGLHRQPFRAADARHRV